MSSVLQGIAAEVIQVLVPALSDAVRSLLIEAVEQLEDTAEETDNEYDDALVDILRAGVDAPDSPQKKG